MSLLFRSVADASEKDLVTLGFQVGEDPIFFWDMLNYLNFTFLITHIRLYVFNIISDVLQFLAYC